ncbi:PREDICTED: uncharacterized protein LOC105363835 [Ceratosolen solmsi marchali]|uniref:Uncharacterized protein LOC105363835 n=1 Tax=Ceratosolen solmsi marchali TaxID=326594 RepID=A0AAJ7DXF3_9HYME|nr:PREDICTED: uncharacterized protein LOC105363835 [Ceratosolen solmsi marchali]
MTTWLLAFLCFASAACTNITDQQTSESQHDQQVAILKQIRKLNEDGSYTYGYEAGDGSFKEQISVVQSIPRNRTSTTRKPNIYMTSREPDTKATVVQSIPRTRKPTTLPTITTTTATTTEGSSRPSYMRPKGRHRFIINGQQRPLVLEEDEVLDEDSQITRPSAGDKNTSMRRVIFTKRPLDQNLRPITEEFEDKEEEIKITTGNSLRRQLQEETTKAAPVVEQEEDQADIYGGALSTSRPLFTTTTPPRVVQRVSGLRHDRQKHIYVNEDNGPIKLDEDQRVYEQQESKQHQQEDRNTAQQILIRTTTRPPTPEARDYIRQSPEPLYLRQQPEGYIRDIPSGGILVQAQGNHLDEDPTYRQIPLSRLLLRSEFNRLLPINQQPLYSGATDANVHYITDSPPSAQEQEEAAPRIPINPAYLARQRAAYQRQLPYPEGIVDPRRALLRPLPQPLPQNEREYQSIGPDYPYRSSQLVLPPEPPNPIAPPLSRRDFQILLRRLLVSQYGIQALSYPKTYLEDALYDQQPYPSYQPAYQTPIPRAEVPYPSEPAAPTAPVAPVAPVPPPPSYPERIPSRRAHMYSRAINPLYQQNQYEEYPEPRFQKRVYRQKFYTAEVPDEAEEILPPQIREALLLRMLQLAINAERPIAMSNTIASTTLPSPLRYRKSGPVRNVQILGEDLDENKMRKKI